MYAIIATGGKQYKAQAGETIQVEKLSNAVGEEISFTEVLMVSDGDSVTVGQPTLANAIVKGFVVEQGKDKKIIVFKFKRRKKYRRKQGHRQLFTAVRIDSIECS